MTSYKTFTPEKMDLVYKDNSLLKTIYKIHNKTNQVPDNYKKRLMVSFFNNQSPQTYLFLILDGKKVIGYNKGFVDKNTYISEHTAIIDRYQGKGYGKKIKLRAVAYLRLRKNITKFDGALILNSKIFNLNEAIAKRKNKTLKGEYVTLKHPFRKGDFKSKDGTFKPKNILKFKKR